MYRLRHLALIIVLASAHPSWSQEAPQGDIPNLHGRWNMDAENIVVQLLAEGGRTKEEAAGLVREWAEGEAGNDVVLSPDRIDFMRGDAVVRSYGMRLFRGGDGSLRIEVFNHTPTTGMVRILDIDGDRMVFRYPDESFDLFRAYKRVRSSAGSGLPPSDDIP